MNLNGLIDLPWWGYVLVTLGLTHITIAGVTIFLHRHQAHRALELHAIPSHFFRFWLWLTTGMVTKEWAAIHRKHHAKCETPEDPHSPQIEGIDKVMWEGAELYRKAANDREIMEKYGHGTPDDWLERHVYTGRSQWGIALMLLIDVLLFGPIGITIWAVQMAWIPIFAAGVINGIGHYWGYRNFESNDTSTNIVPWGILIGGEELHNNHHAYGTSARLSNKWYEFDIGWLYIRIMEILGLAHVKKLAPRVQFDMAKVRCDLATLQAVVTHRYDVLARFGRSLRATYVEELARLKGHHGLSVTDRAALSKLLKRDPAQLSVPEKQQLDAILSKSKVLATVFAMRQELASLWQRSTASKEQLVKQLDDWCHRAEASGIAALSEFSRQLRCYA
ncbi:MAG: acyl-CoA desaturase [Betaproteobacteria bacterium]|nr:acyl-CoA desaturase [Betaproteobacteria bacterium]